MTATTSSPRMATMSDPATILVIKGSVLLVKATLKSYSSSSSATPNSRLRLSDNFMNSEGDDDTAHLLLNGVGVVLEFHFFGWDTIEKPVVIVGSDSSTTLSNTNSRVKVLADGRPRRMDFMMINNTNSNTKR